MSAFSMKKKKKKQSYLIFAYFGMNRLKPQPYFILAFTIE